MATRPNLLGTYFGLVNPLTAFSTAQKAVGEILDPNVDFLSGVSSPLHYYPKGVPTATNQTTTSTASRTSGSDSGEYVAGASTGSYGGGGGGGSTAPSYSAADLAYLDDQQARLVRQQQSADTTLNNGITQLNDSYQGEVNSANTNQSRALSDFATKREDTTRGKDAAITRTNTNARTLADSVRRRLGMASGSGSSAYQLAAPNAVAREASKNRTGVVENYGKNFRDLDTGETRVKQDFASLLENLGRQRASRESDFRAGILDKKNQIDGSLAEVARQRALLLGGGYDQVRSAMAPYAGAIDSRQSELDGLFNRFRQPFDVKPVDVSTPNLRDYTVDRAAINANNAGGAENYSPYAQFLKKGNEEEEQYI